MKLSECTYGKIVVLNYPDGGSIVGMVKGLGQNNKGEPVPQLELQNGEKVWANPRCLTEYDAIPISCV